MCCSLHCFLLSFNNLFVSSLFIYLKGLHELCVEEREGASSSLSGTRREAFPAARPTAPLRCVWVHSVLSGAGHTIFASDGLRSVSSLYPAVRGNSIFQPSLWLYLEHGAVPGLVLLPSSIWTGTENFSINYGVLAGIHGIILMCRLPTNCIIPLCLAAPLKVLLVKKLY